MAYEEFCTDYLVLEPENASLFDLVRIFYSSKLEKRDFFNVPGEDRLSGFRRRWLVFVSVSAQKLFISWKEPMAWIGSSVELFLNYPSSNGGYLPLLLNFMTGRVNRPDKSSTSFRSLIGSLDLRVDLDRNILKGDSRYDAALSVMAAKLSYENEAFARTVVTDHWQMEFLDLGYFWNDFLEQYSTQAIMFQDRSADRNLVVVAFKGTGPFDADAWRTDVDISWYELEGVGKIHGGFMKALGLQKITGWPKETDQVMTGQKSFAYYAIREKLRMMMQENEKARFIVTGHSLGGALAILFAAILILHEETILLDRLEGVYTFGQPRVGDEQFGEFMKKQLKLYDVKYFRYVNANDMVPRLPYDDKTLLYKHFGPSLYYNSHYEGLVLEEEPNKNYFSLLWVLPKNLNAVYELVRGFVLPWTEGVDYREGLFLKLFGMVGLVIPGLADHGPQDYVNLTRLGTSPSFLHFEGTIQQQGLKDD